MRADRPKGENELLFDLAGGNFYDTLWLAIKLHRMRHPEPLHDPRPCQATNKRGLPCRRESFDGGDYCPSHRPPCDQEEPAATLPAG